MYIIFFCCRGRKLDSSPENRFNHFTTEMPNYGKETTPETTEIYNFFGNSNNQFDILNSTANPKLKTKPVVSYSTVIVQGPSPRPNVFPEEGSDPNGPDSSVFGSRPVGPERPDPSVFGSSIRTTRLAAGLTTPIPFFQRPNDKITKLGTEAPPTTTKIRDNDKILSRQNDKFCKVSTVQEI